MLSFLKKSMVSLVFTLAAAPLLASAAPTTTTISIAPSNSVVAGTVVTLTATVKNPALVTRGTVKFCNASLPNCDQVGGLYGSAQLTSAGIATLHYRFGVGIANVKAVFVPTSANAGSASMTSALTVSPSAIYPASLSLSSTGSVGNYTVSGSVNAFGSQGLIGSVPLIDASNGGIQVGTASLNLVGRSFTSPTTLNTGQPFLGLAVGDFNGDGIADLVNTNGDGTISVLLGIGDGTFHAQVKYAVGLFDGGVAVGDFNNDGNVDLAVSNESGNSLSVLLGNGDGTFQTQVSHTLLPTGRAPIAVAIGDFNGDGNLDLALADNTTNVISVLLGNGDGTFSSPASYSTGSSPAGIAIADFNGDGTPDIAITASGINGVSVLLGVGDGTFNTATTYAVGAFPAGLIAGDFNGDGMVDLVVANESSNTVSVLLGKGNGTFQPQTTYATGINPIAVAAGDFNGDGIPDVVVPNNGDNTISILLGNGDGTFKSQNVYAAGTFSDSIVAGDFNGDGLLDFAAAGGNTIVALNQQTASFSASGVSVFGVGSHNVEAQFSDGSRTLATSPSVALTGVPLVATTTLVTSTNNPSLTGQNVSWPCSVTSASGTPTGAITYADNGTTVFTSTVPGGLTWSGAGLSVGIHTITCSFATQGGFAASSASVTQTVNPATATTLTISPSSSVNTGTIMTLTAVVTNPAVVTTGTVKFCNGSMTVCLPGEGLYGSAQLTSAGTAILKMSFGVGTNSVKAVFVPTSTNPGSSSAAQTLTVTASSVYASSTTLTSSGSAGNYTLSGSVAGFGVQPLAGTLNLLDTSNSNAVIGSASLSASGRSYKGASTYAAGATLFSVAVGDFNGDGIPDLASANEGSNTVSVLLGNGDGTFQAQVTYATGTHPDFVAVGDFNGDGIPDLVTANLSSSNVSVLLGNGDGTFQTQVTYATGVGPASVAVGDINDDGIPDLVISNKTDNTVSVLLGNGDGTFQTQVTHATGAAPSSVAVGDFNGDGKVDLAVTNFASATVSLLLGNGDGTFQTQVTYATGTSPNFVAVGDFNGDGKLDLVTANVNSFNVSVLLGNGNGTFQTQVTYATGNTPYSVAVGDFNGDGIPDLAVANETTNTVSVLLGNGNGTFQTRVSYGISPGSEPLSVAVGDFNGDGIPDFVTANFNSPNVSVLLGEESATYSVSGVNIIGSGPHNVLASYSGDGSRTASQSATVALTGTRQSSTVLMSASPDPSTYGGSVIFTATVTAGATGTVTFKDSGVTIGTATLSGATATFSTSTLTGGTHSITGVYGGDSNFLGSTSFTLFQTVNQASSNLNLTSSLNPSTFGSTVTLTATVAAGATGTITFKDGATNLGTMPISSGSASVTISTLLVGSHNISAMYSGDGNFQ